MPVYLVSETYKKICIGMKKQKYHLRMQEDQ